MLSASNKFLYCRITCTAISCMLLLTGCASHDPTKRFSQEDAQRIVSLCSGGMSNSLVAKLAASYQKNVDAIIEAAATYEWRGIIFEDSTMAGLSGPERLQIADKYVSCMKEMEARR